jgi:alkylated DNA repair dioxygenase AlkB
MLRFLKTKNNNEFTKIEVKEVPGLTLYTNFLSHEEQKILEEEIRSKPWSFVGAKGTRQVQQYGFEYKYFQRSFDKTTNIEKLPDFCDFVIDKMLEHKLITHKPEQCIINKYEPGQGISRHTDLEAFGDTVVSMSLGSPTIFEFLLYAKDDDGNCRLDKKEEFFLKPGTLLIMRGDARYKWQHAMPKRKSDIIRGTKVKRKTRISLTFRFTKNT